MRKILATAAALVVVLAATGVDATQTPRVPATCNGLPVTIPGTGGNDTINGTPGDDVIHGGAGKDTIWGHGGNDTICGGKGDDLLGGGPGNDAVFGEGGDDHIDEYLAAPDGGGHDTMDGGPGDDDGSADGKIVDPSGLAKEDDGGCYLESSQE